MRESLLNRDANLRDIESKILLRLKDLKANKPKIAIVYPDVEFGKEGLRAIKGRTEFYNIKMVGESHWNEVRV